MFTNVCYDNLICAHGFSCQKIHQSDGPSSANQNRFSQGYSSSAASMYSHRKWLHKSSFFEANIVWQLEAKVRILGIVSTKVTMIRRSSTKLHFQTQIVSALFAVIAKSTRDPRLNGNAVSNLQMFDVFAAPKKRSSFTFVQCKIKGRRIECIRIEIRECKKRSSLYIAGSTRRVLLHSM